jgi:hypothetical protein
VAYNLNVGQKAQITLNPGPNTNYTFTSTAPTRATVSASGEVTAVSGGKVAIIVTRVADGATIGSTLFDVLAPIVAMPSIEVSVTEQQLNATFTLDLSMPGYLGVTWSGADIVTQIQGQNIDALVIADQGQTQLVDPVTQNSAVWLPKQVSGKGVFTLSSWTSFGTRNLVLAAIGPYQSLAYPIGPAQAPVTAAATSADGGPIISNVAVSFDGEVATISWDTVSPTWDQYFVSLSRQDGNPGVLEEEKTVTVVSNEASAELDMTGMDPGLYLATVALNGVGQTTSATSAPTRYTPTGLTHSNIASPAFAISSTSGSGAAGDPFEASPTPWTSAETGQGSIGVTYIGQYWGTGNLKSPKLMQVFVPDDVAVTVDVQTSMNGSDWTTVGSEYLYGDGTELTERVLTGFNLDGIAGLRFLVSADGGQGGNPNFLLTGLTVNSFKIFEG